MTKRIDLYYNSSNRFQGDEPWSRRVQAALEPLLLQD